MIESPQGGLGTLQQIINDAKEAAEKLGLPPDFLWEIIDDSDWSFIIKLHALLESALEEVIFKSCFVSEYARSRDEAKLRKFCSSLNMSGRTGKVELASVFNLITDDTRKFVLAIADLRNRFAHGVSGASLTIRTVAEESGNAVAFFRPFLPWVNTVADIPTDPRQVRLYISLFAMTRLWNIEFNSRPVPTLLTQWWNQTAEQAQDSPEQSGLNT